VSAPHPVFARRAGVLLHLSSLPARHGVGDLGPEAHRFLDWLQAAGLGWWQMLPIGPVGPGSSPYSSSSAFAGEPLFVSLEGLARDGWLATADLAGPAELRSGPARWRSALAFKTPRFAAAYRRFVRRRGATSGRFRAFISRAEEWLEPYVEHAQGEPGLLRFLQFQFDCQWRALRDAAGARRVRFLGDVPIFVHADSADVVEHPELFILDRSGAPRVVSGCPPDAFSRTGQLWGHPLYDWKAHERTRFRWWRARIARQLDLFDALRLDHFIGYHRAWHIPARAATAEGGRWVSARGRSLLAALARDHGSLPFVAEDLGDVSRGVHALRDEFGLPGMRVLQMGFGEDAYHLPHNAPENAVIVTGTHDNDTIRGWWRSLRAPERRRVLAYAGGSARTVPEQLARLALTSRAHTALIPMQDLLGLGGAARMNRPGKPRGNWRWRLPRGAASRTLARRLHEQCEAAERLPR